MSGFVAVAVGRDGGSSYRRGETEAGVELRHGGAYSVSAQGYLCEGEAWVKISLNGRVLYDGPIAAQLRHLTACPAEVVK